jgi:hypothetical protein
MRLSSFVSFLSFAFVAACSSPTLVVNNQQAAMAVATQEQSTATMAQSYATTTPPANGTSMGMQTSPQAGAVTIPITNVEVYTFQGDLGSGGSEQMYWAQGSDGTVYVWGEIALQCVDDSGNPTGETGTADLVYESAGSDYGWMTATTSCGYSTFFGCSSSGGAETCGGCDFNSEFIACSSISS